MLAGRIDRRATSAEVAVSRRDIDDAAVALGLHYPKLVLHAEERAEDIGIEGRGIEVDRLFGHRTGVAFGAGSVHGYVESTKAGDSPVHQFAQFVIVAHVGTNELGLGAQSAQLRR